MHKQLSEINGASVQPTTHCTEWQHKQEAKAKRLHVYLVCCLAPSREVGDGLPVGSSPRSSKDDTDGRNRPQSTHCTRARKPQIRQASLQSQVTCALLSKGENQSTEWKRPSRYQSKKVWICWATWLWLTSVTDETYSDVQPWSIFPKAQWNKHP